MIAEALAGKRVAITGATGFLGTALVERFLRSVPDCEVGVLVRPGRRGAADRVKREILKNDCFDRLRRELGNDFDAVTSRRLVALAGDVGVDGLGLDDAARAWLSTAHVLVHSAAAVSFDSPIDQAVEINLLGPVRVVETLKELNPTCHMVAVSTAYVAGTRRGDAKEQILTETLHAADIAWRPEVEAARRIRSDLDAKSRTPDMLAELKKRARHELGAAGVPLLAERTEKLREEWVKAQLVDAGVARASALGWPDAYPYTKSLGERAMLEMRGPVPVSIVRPSIIEAALAEPHPGWIRGFRMADPIIISYARGLLKEFPGIPEGVIDVIPVDLVVAALVAVAAMGPTHADPDDPTSPVIPSVYQVASGSRNPLRYKAMVDEVQGYFLEHPLYDAEGQPIVVPDWSFPGRGRVQRQQHRTDRILGIAERVVGSLPLRGEKAEIGAKLEEQRDQIKRALGYVELYGHYTETEALYRVDRLIELFERMPAEDQATFNFDPASYDWSHFFRNIYLPAVVTHARVKTTPGKKTGPSREERGRKAILDPKRQMACFDLENTIVSSQVVDSYSWIATRHLDWPDRVRFVAKTLREAPGLLALDKADRGDFLRHFYRRYENAPIERLKGDAWDLWSEHLLLKAYPTAIRRVRHHRSLGHKTLLITGALDFLVEPFAPLFDEVVSSKLGEANGRYTGELTAVPCTGEARAAIILDYCAANGLDPEQSVAYADSASDLPMLEAVGHPVAVNAEPKLAAIARKRGWHTETFEKAGGSPSKLLPIGARATWSARGRRKAGA